MEASSNKPNDTVHCYAFVLDLGLFLSDGCSKISSYVFTYSKLRTVAGIPQGGPRGVLCRRF